MKTVGVVFLAVLAGSLARNCPAKKSNSKLFCYYSKVTDVDNCYCTHAVLPAHTDATAIERARAQSKGLKILVSVNEFNQGLIDTIKNSKVDGLEINLKKLDSKSDITDFISTVRSKLGSDLYLALAVPSRAEILAKYYDFKSLSKHADLFILQTSFLGASKNVTFHPSRLSGMWDMQNTDSVVDLISGLGAPLSKLVITAPVQAYHFTLQNSSYTAPGSPALEVKSLTRNELCNLMNAGANWTLERDQDQTGPYIFSEDQWIAFDDTTSMDIKAKYSRVRGLAGIALKDVSQDGGEKCGTSVLESAYNGLSRQSRAPRGVVLHSLEREILETHRPVDNVHVSPYRISRVIDVEGKVHVIRQDTRTEFECSRQGYFVHPRSCNRFYRCVKFDQLTEEFSVFEFDCPAGLAFDERVEVCVWPGSLPHGTPCSGSSEIAPVPKQRFACPSEPGYYADPENCRWFFACLDHGQSQPAAYEFRCPFGLVFDSARLLCEWPWLVPKCANGNGLGLASEFVYGGYSAQTPAVSLEQYDGLGRLGVVKLGGITGKFEQPIAKVYSNVGAVGLGYQNGGYVNQDGYITGNGLGGLSLKAGQSLQNAGLLKSNLGLGAGHVGFGGQDNIQFAAGFDASNLQQYNAGSGLAYNSAGAFESSRIGVHAGDNANFNSGNLGGQYQFNLASANQEAGVFAAKTRTADGGIGGQYQLNFGSNLVNANQGAGAHIEVGGFGTKTSEVDGAATQYTAGDSGQYQLNIGPNFGSATDGAGVFGAKNAAEGQYQVNFGTNSDDANLGAKSSQSFVQYHGKNDAVALNNAAGQDSLNTIQYNTNFASDLDKNSGSYGNKLSQAFALGNNVDFGAKSYQTISNIGQAGLNTQYQPNIGSNLNFNSVNTNDFGAKSSQSFVQYHGQNGQTGGNQVELKTVQYQPNLESNIVGEKQQPDVSQFSVSQQANLATNLGYDAFGAKITEGQDAVQNQGQYFVNLAGEKEQPDVSHFSVTQEGNLGANLGYDAFGAKITQGQDAPQNQDKYFVNFGSNTGYNAANDFGAKSSQSSSHGSSSLQGVAGNINIVGGGYSAVGAFKSGVEINSNGENIDAFVLSTPSPITATTLSSVPTVTSVPIPAIKTSNGFESYNGGVVANVPELQYKIQGATKLANISANFINFATTPSSLLVNEAYEVKQPTLTYQTQGNLQQNTGEAVSYSYQALDTSVSKGGYIQAQPTVTSGAEASQNQVVYGYAGSSTVRPYVGVIEQNVAFPTATAQGEGYHYSRPSVAFEEGLAKSTFSISTPTTSRPITIVQEKVQPAVPVVQQPATSYSFHRQDTASGGYTYEKPQVVFEERQQPQVLVSTPQPFLEQKPQVYVSSTVAPIVQKIAQPGVSIYSYTQQVGSGGYDYPKPSVSFEEQPIIQTYHKQPAIVSKFSIRKPIQQIQPAVTASYQPVVQKTVVQPTASTYSYRQDFKSEGYQYSKPYAAFEEKPATVTSYNYQPKLKTLVQNYATLQPSYYQQPQIRYGAGQSTYTYQKPAVTSYTYKDVAQKSVGLYQPAVVSSYSYSHPSTSRPEVLVQHQPVAATYTYSNPTQQPARVSSYSYVAPSTSKPESGVEFGGYDYPKPQVAFVEQPAPVSSYENRQPVEEEPFIKKQAYVTGQANSYQYNQRLDTGFKYSSPATPVVVENYQAPAQAESYEKTKYSQSVDTSNAYFINNVNTVSSTPVYQQEYYSTPVYQEPSKEVYVHTTPKPTYQSTVASVLATKVGTVTQSPNFYFYDSRLSSTPKPITRVGYSYPKPNVVFEERPLQPIVSTTYLPSVAPAKEYLPAQTVTTIKPTYQSTVASILDTKIGPVTQSPNFYFHDSRLSSTPKPFTRVGYSYPKPKIVFEERPLQHIVSTTYLPSVAPAKGYLPAQTVPTSKPIVRYSFSSLDDQYQYVSTPSPFAVRTTPGDEATVSNNPVFVVPEVSTVAQEYLPVRSKVRYTTSRPVEVTTIAREYLPVRTRVKVTTSSPATAYLPVEPKLVFTGAPQEVTTPSRNYLPVKSRVRVTTSERPLEDEVYARTDVQRSGPKVTIVKQNDFHPMLAAKLGAQCTCVSNSLTLGKKKKIIIVEDDDEDDGYAVANDQGVVLENYQYNPGQTIDITPTPQVYLQSTTNEIVPAPKPTYTVRKRVRVRPVTSTVAYQSEELSIENDVAEGPSDKEIASAVRTGLKLVKQAAKEGAKEGAEEAISKYGHSNVRETIECQRAGLFRHPNQCNKFYACRWDCTKNKFTLHTFNCPIHLTFDNSLGACNWPSQGPTCLENTLMPSE